MAKADCTTTYETTKIDDATLRLSAALSVVEAVGIFQENDGDIERPSNAVISGALFAARMLMEDAHNTFSEPIR